MGWEFLEKMRGRKINPQAKTNDDNANTWSLGVRPGNASGSAAYNRKNGAQARGLSRDHARGRIRCRTQPKFPILGVELIHPSDGASSPGRKSGGSSFPSPHHPGSPRSQCLPRLASMASGGGICIVGFATGPGSLRRDAGGRGS